MGNDNISKSPSGTPVKIDGETASRVSERRNFIIAIGIDKYKHPDIPSLGNCCENDCRALIDVLTQDYSFETVSKRYDRHNVATDKEMLLLNEEASLDSLKSVFDNLRYHPDFDNRIKNAVKHNLIIYYSGHGTLALNNGKNMFYWVPYDYDADLVNPDTNLLYSLQYNLVNSLGSIRYQHLILISDSCHSGGSIELADYFDASGQATKSDPAEERSCWALCSSATNQKSFTHNNLSVFTEHLVNALNENTSNSFSAESLFVDLFDIFKSSGQRIFHKRLGILENNTGQFYFTENDCKIGKNRLKAIHATIANSVTRHLNFSNEKKKLTKLKSNSHFVFVISSSADSGLKLLMKSLKNDVFFPGFRQDLLFVDDTTLNTQFANAAIEKLYVYFNGKLGLNCQTEETLVGELLKKLNGGKLVLGIYLRRKSKENIDLVNAIIRLVEKLNNNTVTKYSLYFFILDENNTDYSGLQLASYDRFQASLIANDIFVQQDDFDEWFSQQVSMLNDEMPDKEYIVDYIQEKIYEEIANNYMAERPGKIVRRMCELAKCPGLADTLLNSIDKLPLNY